MLVSFVYKVGTINLARQNNIALYLAQNIYILFELFPSIVSYGHNKIIPTNNKKSNLDNFEKRHSLLTYKLKFRTINKNLSDIY